MIVLVAGGSGLLGAQLVAKLLDRGVQVRVLTRDPTRARAALPGGVELVQGDVRNPTALQPACDGVNVVVSAVQGFVGSGGASPATVDRDGNLHLVEAAERAGAAFVLMSVVGASPEHPMELFRMKFAAEQRLRASRVTWTIVRATAFRETWSAMLVQRPIIFGRGDNPINFVPVEDVAHTVEHAILDASTRGQILEIGGPENLSLNQLAQRFGTKPRHVPRALVRGIATVARPISPMLARIAHAALVMDTHDFTFQQVQAAPAPHGLESARQWRVMDRLSAVD